MTAYTPFLRSAAKITGKVSALVLSGVALGMLANSIRKDHLTWTPVFSFEHDCPGEVRRIGPISVKVAAALLGRVDVLFLDARPAGKFLQGHLKGARSQPYDAERALPGKRLKALLKIPRLITYGDDPEMVLSTLLGGELSGAGHRDVRYLKGGYKAWLKAGHPVEKGKP